MDLDAIADAILEIAPSDKGNRNKTQKASMQVENQANAVQAHQIPHHAGETSSDQCDGTPTNRPLNGTPNIPNTPPSNHKPKQCCRECREWIKLGVEVLTLLVVGFYAVVNGEMYGQMIIANGHSRDSATAATIAARAAEKANTIAQTSMEIGNRAWLAPSLARFSTSPLVPQVGQYFEFWIDFVNPGRLPAIDVAFYGKEKRIPLPVPIPGQVSPWRSVRFDDNDTCAETKTTVGGVAIFPGNGPFTETMTSTRPYEQAINEGSMGIYFLGCATYGPRQARRYTAFCAYYEKSIHRFKVCPTGNSAD